MSCDSSESFCACGTAVITLKDEEASAAAIAALNGKTFHDCKVEVKFNPCNRLLCIGNLPSNMKDSDFRELVQSYGPVERCFLNGFDTGMHGICILDLHILAFEFYDNLYFVLY